MFHFTLSKERIVSKNLVNSDEQELMSEGSLIS